MNRNVVFAASALALGTVAYVGSQLTAQTPAAPAAAAASGRGTRIATLNLAYVIKNYQKFVAFENEMKNSLKQFDDRLAAKRKQMEEYQKEAALPATTEPRKQEIERQARGLQREVEDINNDAKAFIGKKRDEQIVQLYKEVQDAAQRYALAQGIDIVMHYTDATTQADYYNPVNVARKMQSPGCMPIYAAAGTDISQEVVMSLNTHYRGSSAAAPNGDTAAARQP